MNLTEKIQAAIGAEDGAEIGAIVDQLRLTGMNHAACMARFIAACPHLNAAQVDDYFYIADEASTQA